MKMKYNPQRKSYQYNLFYCNVNVFFIFKAGAGKPSRNIAKLCHVELILEKRQKGKRKEKTILHIS